MKSASEYRYRLVNTRWVQWLHDLEPAVGPLWAWRKPFRGPVHGRASWSSNQTVSNIAQALVNKSFLVEECSEPGTSVADASPSLGDVDLVPGRHKH